MTRHHLFLKRLRIEIVLLLVVLVGMPWGLSAQSPPPPPGDVGPQLPAGVFATQAGPVAPSRDVVRVGSDYTLRADERARDVVVIAANGAIDGDVDGDVVVVLGQARLGATAVIDGSLVVVGGSVTVAEGAVLRDDLVVVGGALEAPPSFAAGGDHVGVGPVIGRQLTELFTWMQRGLFLGRPIAPSLPWVWTIVGLVFCVYFLLNLVLERPIRASAETLADRPLSAFVVGVLVILLAGPVAILLAVSVVGLLIVPLLATAIVAAAVLGRVAVARWIGGSIWRQSEPDSRGQAIRSFVIGFAVITLAYVIPVLGLMAWTILGVFGLGAAAMTFAMAYRSENPVPPPQAAPAPLPAGPFPADVTPGVDPDMGTTPRAPSSASTPASAELALFPRARFRDRLAAGVLDLILVMIAWRFLDPVVRDNGFFLLMLSYFIGFWAWKGTTVGGIICQLRVVRVDNGRLRFADALVRGLSSIFSMIVLGLGFLWILRDPDRQAWHDKIAGTFVVRVPRNWPL